jgi:large subunit ribosomal protein L6
LHRSARPSAHSIHLRILASHRIASALVATPLDIMVAPTASGSSLARQVGGMLLSSSRVATTSALPRYAFSLSVRHSHVGSAPLDLPTSTSIEILPFPPHPNPSRPLLPSLRHARSALVKGPKGEVVVPLHECVTLLNASKPVAVGSTLESARITLSIKDDSSKKQRGTWGLTRSLLHNALVGVSEGHTVSLKLVGVGYRASIEPDPLPRTSKLDIALASSKSFFLSEAAKQAEVERAERIKQEAEKQGPNQRLHIRLGYSHPVLIPVPYGVQVQIPQPNRIVIKGADREQLGLFASQIRSWRKPEPYKGKGIFVDDETIRLKTAKKK